MSGRHTVLMSPKASPPASPLTSPSGGRRRAPSDAEEFLASTGSPARRTFWASIFKSTDKPNSTEKPHASDLGVHSTKTLAEVQLELQRCFDSLGVEWQISDTGFRAKYASIEGTMSCQFNVNITRLKKAEGTATQSHFIEFKFDKGDCDLYNDMCSVVEKSLKL